MKLSNSFTLAEMLKSNTALRLNIVEQFNPNKLVIDNLTRLCKEVLQPIRDALEMPVRVTSGYRCKKLNKAIGGSNRSQHITGEAADIELWIRGEEKNAILLDKIMQLYYQGKFNFDQLIIEYPDISGIPKWVHISYSDKNRNQILIAERINNKTVYKKSRL
tara:strand:+ start:17420 stop:17905 length:486 start_codon:yes stop_codon:yes gene_type:complete